MKKKNDTTPETDAVKFETGSVLLRPQVLRLLSKSDVDGVLRRHERGDWGVIGYQGEQLNKQALKQGGKLASVYETDHDLLVVITEADRKSTFVALRDDPVWEMLLADVATSTEIATH